MVYVVDKKEMKTMIYTLDEIKSIVEPIAIRYGLRAVYVFGSYANGTARANSDIDLLVDTTGTRLNGLFALGELYCELEEALQKSIDLLTVSSLEQEARMESDRDFRTRIQKERLEIYAVA